MPPRDFEPVSSSVLRPPSDRSRPVYSHYSQLVLLGFLAVCVVACIATPGRAADPVTDAARESNSTERSSPLTRQVSFELDVLPIFSAAACNSGPCHGKARGQNGFQLSLLAFDPDFDHHALTRQARGRRVFPAAPERSLLLEKALGIVPHGGGQRLEPGGVDHQVLLRWIEQGAQRRVENEPTLTGVEISHAALSLSPGENASLRVTARYSDGTVQDVTRQATFQSNEAGVVTVEEGGQLEAGPIPGEAAIMARYMNTIAICQVTIPLDDPPSADFYADLPRNNFIDDLVWKKLQHLGLTPSELVDDAGYLRRIYLDVIGRLPTPTEVRTFLADDRSDKRQRALDALLERPEFADFWANKWVDLLRPNPYRVGIKAVLNYDNWIRQQFRANKPYDEFVAELLTARGSTWRNGAVTLFRDRRSPDEVATLTSQLFLGIRLECAKCHHHPFEKWSQEDFYSFAAFFRNVGYKGTGLSPPISGSEEVIQRRTGGQVKHPLTQESLEPRPLFGALDLTKFDDEREALTEWMRSPDNPYFAQVMANRVWADLMGRGLVEPIDDIRATNPATNPELLAKLGEYFRERDFDLKQLVKVIASSRAYQLSSVPNDRNIGDSRNYSRALRRRLRAEVLLDSLGDITELPEEFPAMPADSRAMSIWTHRTPSVFLDTFGRPDPNQDPPCERTGETTVVQALHLMNSETLNDKIRSDKGIAARLAASEQSDDAAIEEIYLRVYSRFPTEDELQVARDYLKQKGRRRGIEDLLWATLNTPEFFIRN